MTSNILHPVCALQRLLQQTDSCLAAVSLASDDKQEEVQAAKTAEDMWKAIGKDSWVVVPIASTSRPGQPSRALLRVDTRLSLCCKKWVLHESNCLLYRLLETRNIVAAFYLPQK